MQRPNVYNNNNNNNTHGGRYNNGGVEGLVGMEYIGARTPQTAYYGTGAKYYRQGGSSFAGLLMFAGLVALIISLYVVMITHVNYSENDNQNRLLVEARSVLEQLALKDMILMDNVTNLETLLNTERSERLANATNLQTQITTEVQQRIEKDMILMDNITQLTSMLDSLDAFDVFALEQFMIKMGNISSLQDEIDQQQTTLDDQVEKDMILMSNVSVLDSRVNIIEGDLTNLIIDNSMIFGDIQNLNQNITDLSDALALEMSVREAADVAIDVRLNNLEAKDMTLMTQIAIMQSDVSGLNMDVSGLDVRVTALEAMTPIETINGIVPDMSNDFSIDGSTNIYDNRISILSQPNGLTLHFDPFTGLDPRATYVFFGTDTCKRGFIAEAAPSNNLGFIYYTGSFGMRIHPSSGLSLLNPIGASCNSGTCQSGWETGGGCDQNDNCSLDLVVPDTGAFKIPAGPGTYVFTVSARYGEKNPASTDEFSTTYLDYGVRTNPVGSKDRGIWELCASDSVGGDPQFGQRARVRTLTCTLIVHDPVVTTWYAFGLRYEGNQECACNTVAIQPGLSGDTNIGSECFLDCFSDMACYSGMRMRVSVSKVL